MRFPDGESLRVERLSRKWARVKTTGTRIRKINPACTSRTCPVCKRVDAASRKSQVEFVCTACSRAELFPCRTCGCGWGEEHTGRRAWRLPDVEPSRRRPGP
ncbi:zinc ribbon domain-containing protein [Streptomyces sp. NPDC056352]|uniref:zinc ribbon domain-containing protein n=1 Tax=Streptomyces sp. NPDC056352 TaxID=3345791 RepID=UPI0035E01FF3